MLVYFLLSLFVLFITFFTLLLDAGVSIYSPSSNDGNYWNVVIGSYYYEGRNLLRAPLTAIPASSNIISAQLYQLKFFVDGSPLVLGTYRVSDNWVEGGSGATWNSQPTSLEQITVCFLLPFIIC